MSQARFIFSLAAVLLCSAIFLAACASEHESSQLEQAVDALVMPLLAAKQFSGAVVLTRKGKVVYERGFGLANHAQNIPFTPQTPSDGASLAKTFTAAGIWSLVQEGKIQIDTPVTQYLPEYPHAQTTVRQLISHSNGLPPYYEFFDAYFEPEQVRSTDMMLQIVAKQIPMPLFEPGTRFEYSNFGFDVAALLIERVAGISFESFVKQRFFDRLEMNHSFARPAKLSEWNGTRTMGYQWRDTEWQIVDVFDMEAFLGASNLYFSAADLSRWASAHANRSAISADVFELGKGRSFIAGLPSAINGLSWYCDHFGGRCYYTGSLNAFHSLVYWDRVRDESVVLVSNSSIPAWQAINLQRNLVAVLAGNLAEQESAIDFLQLDKTAQPSLVGKYTAQDGLSVVIWQQENRMMLREDNGLDFEAFAVGNGMFYVPGSDYWIGFSRSANSTTLHLRSMFVDWQLQRATASQ